MNLNSQLETRRRVISIDSRFREDYNNSSTTDFKYTLIEPIKNVCKMSLLTAEIPNTEYVFSTANKNLNFIIQTTGSPPKLFNIVIPEGNYTAATLVTQIATLLITINDDPIDISASISLSPISGKITITTGKPVNFVFGIGYDRPFDFGLGFNLGFRQKYYLNTTSITSEGIINVVGDNYYLLQLDDYGYVQHKTWYKETIRAFAKIPNSQDKNVMVFDDFGNQVIREYVFPNPTDIHYFNRIRLCNSKGDPVDLNKMNISLTLELVEIVNSKSSSGYGLMKTI